MTFKTKNEAQRRQIEQPNIDNDKTALTKRNQIHFLQCIAQQKMVKYTRQSKAFIVCFDTPIDSAACYVQNNTKIGKISVQNRSIFPIEIESFESTKVVQVLLK